MAVSIEAEDWRDAVNPVLAGFFPDPSVCRVDGDGGAWFYLVSSTFEYLPGLPVHRSRDLVHWELVGHVLDRPGQADLTGVGDSGGLFAPTIRHDGDRFLVVCTVVGGVPGSSGNFVVTATDPAGPWSDPVWWQVDGIDPSILVDGDRLWAHGTRLARDPEWDQQTEVWVREVDPSTLLPGEEEHIVWTGAVRGAVWAEGPHLYRREGRYYLLAAEGGTGFDHAVVVARADHPTGPYMGSPANPVLSHRQLGRGSPVTNVGHADLVEHPDGSTWALCLATRPWHGGDRLGRETFLVDVEWQDGWPVFAPGVGRLSSQPPRPESTGGHESTTPGTSNRVAVRRLPSELGATELPGDRMRLAAGEGLGSSHPAYLAERLTTLDGEVAVQVLGADPGVRAGMGLRYSSTAYLSATVGGTGLAVEVVSRTSDPVRVVQSVAGATGRMTLTLAGAEATVSFLPDDDRSARAVSLGPFDITELCTAADGGFVGLTHGVLAIGDGAATFGGDQQ